MMVTGRMLRGMREEQGYSQAALAKLAGVSQAHIAKIESGRVDPRLSTVNGILAVLEKGRGKPTCGSVMKRHIVSARPEDSVIRLIATMKRLGISQVPVLIRGKNAGSVHEGTIIHNAHRNIRLLRVSDIIDRPFPVVNASDPADMLAPLLDFHPAVLVTEKGRIAGIVTKSDLLKM
ncbi:MAG: CBS domain-containing protein [Candidatus Aenigmarchaeota archaeon]|nr:CBS domain-containing protein [Candidatus Aenigmarchaeota archaeon]